MHSMPATTLHPTGGFFVGQSLDNKIVTWTARDKFRQMKKKEFKGHVNAGYACRMAFSPNGKFLASGDGQGKMYIWDWGSTKVYRKLQVRWRACVRACMREDRTHSTHAICWSFFFRLPPRIPTQFWSGACPWLHMWKERSCLGCMCLFGSTPVVFPIRSLAISAPMAMCNSALSRFSPNARPCFPGAILSLFQPAYLRDRRQLLSRCCNLRYLNLSRTFERVNRCITSPVVSIGTPHAGIFLRLLSP